MRAVEDSSVIIHLPVQVIGQNRRERMHWAAQRREVSMWAARAGYAFLAQGLPPATGKRRVSITSYRKQRFRDEANMVGGCKGLIDGLVRAKVLVDDSTKWATFEYHQYLASKSPLGRGVPCTSIQIEES